MSLRRGLFAAIGLWLAMLTALPVPAHGETPRPAYAVGQVWAYKTRPQERGSQLTIVRIEDLAGEAGIPAELGHSQESLDASVTKLVKVTKQLPDISAGYAEWTDAGKESGAGVFTIPVAEIVQRLEDIITGKIPTARAEASPEMSPSTTSLPGRPGESSGSRPAPLQGS